MYAMAKREVGAALRSIENEAIRIVSPLLFTTIPRGPQHHHTRAVRKTHTMARHTTRCAYFPEVPREGRFEAQDLVDERRNAVRWRFAKLAL